MSDYDIIDYQNGFAMLCDQMGIPQDASFARMREVYNAHKLKWLGLQEFAQAVVESCPTEDDWPEMDHLRYALAESEANDG